MAARDILTLKTPMAEGIIRLLYTIALILIFLGVLFGVARGVMIMTHAPMQRPAITAPATPDSSAVTPQAPQTDAQNARPEFRPGMRGDFRGWHRFGHHRYGMMMGRSPMGFGLMMIVGSLLRGLIALLLIRVLAEIGLAVLGMPKRTSA
ncbi:MAG: hypothetical protein V4527_17715 [Pseudomonadota bacterium]